MKKLIDFLQNRQTQVSAVLLFLFSIAVVVYLIPREAQFKYEFQKGKPWLYEDLVAPFDYAILKSPEELTAQKKEIRANKTLFLKEKAGGDELKSFQEAFPSQWTKAVQQGRFSEVLPEKSDTLALRDSVREKGVSLLRHLYDKGLLQPLEGNLTERYGELLLTKQGRSRGVQREHFYSLQEAANWLQDTLNGLFPPPVARWSGRLLVDYLQYNIVLDESRSLEYLQSQLKQILPTKGMVQKGEIIIFKGNLVDGDKFAKLRSLKEVYEGSLSDQRAWYFLLGGQVLLVSILFLIMYLLIYQFRPQVLEDISRLTFILVNVLLMVMAARLVLSFDSQYIYLVPFAILPLVLRSFFDTQFTLFMHILAMLIIGFVVQNSFEFIFLQITAGVFAIVLVDRLYKRSQLFFTAGKITLVYCISYLSLAVLQEGSFQGIDYWVFPYFVLNGLLTLISFPLIYFQEKLFGFTSDVSLLELSDTNSPLLRKLSQQAPGTFQHSLQVANLAEAAVNAVKGNTLLVRTGALYHDIGKMQSPMYFIENQTTGINPHDELSFSESAQIIISHVREGIRLAKRYALPDMLIDFIRTHHGTTTVMYFYKQYIKNFPEDPEALSKFTYPGPKPFSKESAILMMADSVEAASRSLSKPDHETLEGLVERLIDHQIEMGQFENAPITLREIRQVKKIFKKMLMNIYHVRIQYPE